LSGQSLQGKRILLAGCGDIGTGLGERLLARGAEVHGLRRTPDRLPDGFVKVAGDFLVPATLRQLRGQVFDHVVITLTPTGHSDEAYAAAYVTGLRNLLAVLEPAPDLVCFVSSTSVYHQDDHGWVDENSPTEPTTFAGLRTLEAEGLVAASGFSFVIVRFSGIYGPGRTHLIDQVRGGSACGPEHRVYTNRLHREDGIGFLEHLILMHERSEGLQELYLATDSHAATMWDVQSWLATHLGLDPFALKTGPVPGRTSKRCRNNRMRETRYQLVYPDFMRGYAELLSG
jgi:nucleoside-diphosphate-sugar epimerase